MSESAARVLLRERSQGLCELCWEEAAGNAQHRQNRSQGGQWTLSNLVHVCGSGTTGCHGRIHANPALAVHYGWMVPSHLDPAGAPVWMRTPTLGLAWTFLADDGGVNRCAACSCPPPTGPGPFWIEQECPVHGATAHRATPDNPMPHGAAVHGYRLQGGGAA